MTRHFRPGNEGQDGDEISNDPHPYSPHNFDRRSGQRFPGFPSGPGDRMPGGPGSRFASGPARFGPRDAPSSASPRRRKGAARDAILSLLSEKPFNGYGLIKEISDRTADTWHPSPGSIYPTLQQLVDEGLIEATSDDKRTEFRLTAEGRVYAGEHAEDYARLWQSAAEHSEANGDIRHSVGQLIGVTQQFRFAATPEQRAQAVKLIDATRRALYRILGE